MEPKKHSRIAITVAASPRVHDTIERLAWAEDEGFSDAWFSDAGAPDTLTTIAAVARDTRKLRIGVAVTPVYTRSPAVIAASTYVIQQLLPQRFVLGLGTSSQTIMGAWNGIALEKPLQRMAETTTLVKAMLRGEKTDFDGEILQSHGYRQPSIAEPPPIYLAALRPKMIELAAAVGDGVIFNLWPRGALRKMIEHVRIGAERAGKSVADLEIVNRAMVLCTDDKAVGRALFRKTFAPYYATPVYNSFLAWAGYAHAADSIELGWREKDRVKTATALSDELIDEIAIIGDEDEIHARVRADAEGGIDTHIIAPLPGSSEDLERTFAAFAPKNFSF